MKYRLFDNPDNADSTVEDFATIEQAAKRGAAIIRYSDPDWSEADIITRLKAGAALSYHDYSEIRIEPIN